MDTPNVDTHPLERWNAPLFSPSFLSKHTPQKVATIDDRLIVECRGCGWREGGPDSWVQHLLAALDAGPDTT